MSERPPGTLLEAAAALHRGELSAGALLRMCLARIDDLEPRIRAMVTVTAGAAREQAEEADRRLGRGERGPMLGIPVVLKDLVDVAGVRTTAGSKVLHDNVAARDADVWARLRAAGAVLVGKANTHEFAYGGTTAPTRNPADSERIVGGSSGGPAAALAAGFCLGAVGTDTAGSIRIPANLCGVAGLKPSTGLVSTEGVVPLSATLDCVGPMARSVADLRPLLQTMIPGHYPPPARQERSSFRPRIGLLTLPGRADPGIDAVVAKAVAAVGELGAEVTERELPGFDETVSLNFTVLGVEAALYHRRWRDRAGLYTSYVRERLAEGARTSGVDYLSALRAADLVAARVERALDGLDALLLPGMPCPAPPAYDERILVGGAWEDRDTALCRNAAFTNLSGHPTLAVPAGLVDGLPAGVQLVGRRGADLSLLMLGERLEGLLPPGLPDHLHRLG